MTTMQRVRYIGKPLVFAACALPALLVAGDLFGITGTLGANPIEEILDRCGNWGLRGMMIVLAVTPLRVLTGRHWIGSFRRMLGLFAAFYVGVHFAVWLVLDQGLYLPGIAEDIVERPFISIGIIALLLLGAMTATSTDGMRRRLGRQWQGLHYGAYLTAILGVWHYWWQVKADILEPAIYAAILTLLLGFRLWRKLARRSSNGPVRPYCPP